MKKKKILIIISGPTAIGKTKLSIKISKKISNKIISSDSRQIYKEMNIGTIKPSINEISKIKHHLIHSQSIKKEHNTGLFEKKTTKIIHKIFQKKNIIIITGGSGLNTKSISTNLSKIPYINQKIRKKLKKYKIKSIIKKIKKINIKYYKIDLKNKKK